MAATRRAFLKVSVVVDMPTIRGAYSSIVLRISLPLIPLISMSTISTENPAFINIEAMYPRDIGGVERVLSLL